jgi:hypothetical protein
MPPRIARTPKAHTLKQPRRSGNTIPTRTRTAPQERRAADMRKKPQYSAAYEGAPRSSYTKKKKKSFSLKRYGKN